MDIFWMFKRNPRIAYVVAQLKQPSSWRGFMLLLTSLGVAVSPEQSDAIVAAGLAIAGAIGVLAPDEVEALQ
jgi:hypothetical protein